MRSRNHSTSPPPQGDAAPAPLAEHLRHHLAADDARELQVAVVVDAAQLGRLEVEQQREVVVAHVLEVPAAAGVARHAGLPTRVVHDEVGRRLGEHLLDRRLVGHVGERQALRGEAHFGAASVLAADGGSRRRRSSSPRRGRA